MEDLGALFEILGKAFALFFAIAAPVGVVAKLLIDSYLRKNVATAIEQLKAENQKQLISFERRSAFYSEFFPKFKKCVQDCARAYRMLTRIGSGDKDEPLHFLYTVKQMGETSQFAHRSKLEIEFNSNRIFLSLEVCDLVDEIYKGVNDFYTLLPLELEFAEPQKEHPQAIQLFAQRILERCDPREEAARLEDMVLQLEKMLRKDLLGGAGKEL